jgi:hypothetical protein
MLTCKKTKFTQDEAAKGVVQVKNLATGQQTEVLAFFFFTSAYASIAQHSTAYASIRQHMTAYEVAEGVVLKALAAGQQSEMLTLS